jgi:hypothetical protein
MINIFQGRTNTFTLSDLHSKTTIPDASLHYIFQLIDSNFAEIVKELKDISLYPERYSTFISTDGSDFTVKASGEYNIYEASYDASIIDISDPSIMRFLENGQYSYFRESVEDVVFDPSLYVYNAVDYVFDPIFKPGPSPVTSIPHNELLDRERNDNHPQYLPEASLGSSFTWNNGTVDVSGGFIADPSINDIYDRLEIVDSSIENISNYQGIQDASIAALEASIGTSMDYVYVDGSLALRDASIDWLNTNKQPIGNYIKDSSIGSGLIWNAGLLDVSVASGTGDVTKIYVDGSLADRDVSIAWLNANKADTSDIPTDFYSQSYVDGSLAARDVSIDWLNTNKLESSDLAPYSLQTYVDGSLAIRDISIAYNTNKNVSQDASIVLKVNQTLFDSSLASLWAYEDIQDASIAALGTMGVSQAYVDGSLSARDTSITWLNINKLESDDLAPYALQTYVDGSLNAKQNIIPDGTFLKEVSLGPNFIWGSGLLDVSVAGGTGDVTKLYVDGSLATRDSLISQNASDIDDVSTRIPTDFYSQAYVDGSLNAKQNLIPDGTFLKEVSIGSGLSWNAGLLDVSIASGSSDASLGGLKDVSLGGLSNGDLLEYNSTLNKWVPADMIDLAGIFVKEASLGDGLVWEGGLLDVSAGTGDVTKIYVDGSLAERDASISNLYSSKQNNIPDGTFLKESSLGEGLSWNSGSLDVSIAGGVTSLSELSDVTITNASTGDILMFETDKWNNKPAVDIADVLVDIADILVDATDIFYTKTAIDSSFYNKDQVNILIADVDVSIKGALNMIPSEPCDASIYAGLDSSGNLQFKRILGTTAVKITEYSDYIDINIDASFAGEVNAADNIGIGDASLFISKDVDGVLDFRTFKTNSPEIILSNDASYVYIDASIDYSSTLSGLSDVTVTNASTGDALIFGTVKWENKPTVDIDSVLVDIADILVEADSILYSKTQIDASFALKTEVPSRFDVSIGGLTDTSVGLIDNTILVYDSSKSLWIAEETIEIENYFYSKSYIDGSLNNKQNKLTLNSPTSSATGVQGDIAFDASYFYVCTSTNKWGRILLQTGY